MCSGKEEIWLDLGDWAEKKTWRVAPEAQLASEGYVSQGIRAVSSYEVPAAVHKARSMTDWATGFGRIDRQVRS